MNLLSPPNGAFIQTFDKRSENFSNEFKKRVYTQPTERICLNAASNSLTPCERRVFY